MNASLIWIQVQNEMRLRSRRLSSVAAILLVVGLAWLIVQDPKTGHAMFVMNKVRALYNSEMLSMASATLISPLFALLSFYLVRGRIGEDLRSGVGGVIGSTQVGNTSFLFSRWLGGVAYLLLLLLAFMLSVMGCQVIRGEAPLQILPYLQAWLLVLLPSVFFSISCAILFDSVPFLMGKGGDVLYFLLWMAQLSMVSQMDKYQGGGIPYWMAFDMTGMVGSIANLKHFVGKHFSLGGGNFDPALPPRVMPLLISDSRIYVVRALSALLALLPMVPAIRYFHRYSPDRVKAGHSKQRRSPLAVLNDWLHPVARLAQPLFSLGASLPGMAGKVVCDIALSLIASPAALLALLVLTLLGLVGPSSNLPGVLLWSAIIWGILISDISTRDFQANLEDMTAAVPGGAGQRYVRQILASVVLGLLVMGPIALRFASHPAWAMGVLVGIFSFSTLAALLGRTSRTARTFLALFLFWVYVALNANKEAVIDIIGFNGVVNQAASMQHLMLGVAALVLGIGYNRWRSE